MDVNATSNEPFNIVGISWVRDNTIDLSNAE